MAQFRETRKFDRPLLIERRDTVYPPSDSGEGVTQWEEVARPWARREVIQTSEAFKVQQFEAKVMTRYRLRHQVVGLEHHMRLTDVINGKQFDITGILEQERHMGGQLLDCFEHAD